LQTERSSRSMWSAIPSACARSIWRCSMTDAAQGT
jgi:hypothetical protein